MVCSVGYFLVPWVDASGFGFASLFAGFARIRFAVYFASFAVGLFAGFAGVRFAGFARICFAGVFASFVVGLFAGFAGIRFAGLFGLAEVVSLQPAFPCGQKHI